ncbi:MAG: hypothetical protein JXB35_10620, partial [Anaerolineae bacterium]|nr:hypothetical protein [Anaerolineae bacterium]
GGKVDVTVTGNTGYVTGWIDWNQDGDFNDSGEQIFINETINAGETRTLTFDVPVNPSNQSFYGRFRVYPNAQTLLAPPTPDGPASGGEVEDAQFILTPTAVTLAAFEAAAQPGGVLITWETASEIDLLGFNVLRSENGAGPRLPLNKAPIPAQFPGGGLGALYTYLDDTALPATGYDYWLEVLQADGAYVSFGPVQAVAVTDPNALGVSGFRAHANSAGLLAVVALVGVAGVLIRRQRP